MTAPNVQARFVLAENGVQKAIMELVRLKTTYLADRAGEWRPRINALDAKIDALKAVAAGLNPDAHPWVSDWKDAP